VGYLGLCQRRHWPEPRYYISYSSGGYRCVVRVNNREYQTPRFQSSESTAKEEAALIAFNICRSFSANDGMYPTGFAHGGVIQGNPVPVGSGRHSHRDSNSSLDRSEYHYTSDSNGSRSGGSSPDYGSRRYLESGQKPSRHDPAPPRPVPQYSRHPSRRH
jgi:hypothetical protein